MTVRLRRCETFIRLVAVLLLLGAGGAPSASASPLAHTSERPQAPNAASDTAVVITISADTSSRWLITERFRTGAADDSATVGRFQFLARPCATVGDVVITNGRKTASLVVGTNGPWRTITDTSAVSRTATSTDGVEVRYVVARDAGDIDIPLIVPARPIPMDGESRLGSVTVVVRLPDARGRVSFPRLTRPDDDREWRGTFVAVPSFVHVRLTPDARACAKGLPAGDDGGLTWRFWLLVAILVIWVPTYQWWARRQTDGDA